MSRTVISIVATALGATALLVPTAPAVAAPEHTQIPSEVPSAGTPGFGSGRVNAITQVGSTMVVGGTFDDVTPPGGAQRSATGIAAFNATTGQLVSGFSTTLNGDVEEVLPGPDPGTVYVSGSFTQVNGAAQSHVTLLDVATGQVVSGFRPAATNGRIDTITVAQGRLLVGGSFTTAGGQPHGGLASLHPRTGALDGLMGIDVSGHHNDSGSGAQGAVGVRDMEATSDGSKLAVIGNFTQADGFERDQAMVVDLTSTSATVDADWRTTRYEPYCFKNAFDSYMRGLAVSPDGSYFVISTTGGGNPGTLCDAIARFDFDATGQGVQPVWSSASGGDTLWGVEVTENAVYVGGHQRWMNNSDGRDSNGQGSVPRPGISAHDPDSGVPLSWNPGRNPRGVAAYALFATPAGLWVGSNTTWVGNRRYRRERLAFFPLAGGAAPHPETTPGLPGDVYLGGAQSLDQGNVLHRVNAGGAALPGIDGGPGWLADEQATSPYRNTNSNTAGYDAGASRDGTVPASTPDQVFDTERWSPNDNPAMSWDFPTPSGLPLQVRLYFANRCTCTNDPGERKFDVSLEGQTVLENFDIAAAVGDQRGTMRAFDITSDGNVDLDFAHVVENPLVNAIEIVRRDLPPPAQADNALTAVGFDGSTPETPAATDPRGVTWNDVRGAFVVGDTLFTAETDGYFHRREFTEDETGPDEVIDPYNDPFWSDVDTGSNNTFRGRVPNLYGQIGSLTGLTYDSDRIYYTRSGDNQLYWRWFNADSGIIGSETFTANGGRSWSDTGGLFVDGDTLYVVSRSTGDLLAVPFDDGPQGSATLVDDTVDWRADAVFLGPQADTTPRRRTTRRRPRRSRSTARSWSASSTAPARPTPRTTSRRTRGPSATAAPPPAPPPATPTPPTAPTPSPSRSLTVPEPPTPPPSRSPSPVTPRLRPPATSPTRPPPPTPATTSIPPSSSPPPSIPATSSSSSAATRAPTSPTDPAGWSRVDDDTTTGMHSVVWTRTATADDAGSTVTTPMGVRRKFSLTLTAHTGVDPTTPIAAIASATDTDTSQHPSPTLQAPAGARIIQAWTDKSSTTDTWTAPPGTTVRETAYGSGGGRISSLLTDHGPVTAGSAGGQTATTNAPSGKAITWTIALRPGS